MSTNVKFFIKQAMVPDIRDIYIKNVNSPDLEDKIENALITLYALKEKCRKDMEYWYGETNSEDREMISALQVTSLFFEIDDEIEKGLIIKQKLLNNYQIFEFLRTYKSQATRIKIAHIAEQIENRVNDINKNEPNDCSDAARTELVKWKRRIGVGRFNSTDVRGTLYIKNQYNYTPGCSAEDIVDNLKPEDELSWVCVNGIEPIIITHENIPIGHLGFNGINQYFFRELVYCKELNIDKITVREVITQKKINRIITTGHVPIRQKVLLNVYLTETNTE